MARFSHGLHFRIINIFNSVIFNGLQPCVSCFLRDHHLWTLANLELGWKHLIISTRFITLYILYGYSSNWRVSSKWRHCDVNDYYHSWHLCASWEFGDGQYSFVPALFLAWCIWIKFTGTWRWSNIFIFRHLVSSKDK